MLALTPRVATVRVCSGGQFVFSRLREQRWFVEPLLLADIIVLHGLHAARVILLIAGVRFCMRFTALIWF